LISSADVLRRGADPWQRLVKILPHVSQELAIRGMVGGLDADDYRIERGDVLLHVPKKVQLRHRRPDQQNLIGSRKRTRDFMKKSVIVVGMITRPCVHILGMAMDVVVWRLNCCLAESLPIQVKDTSLIMIDPHR
jgi:hypothetical protein